MIYALFAAVVVVSYLIGSVNSSILLSKAVSGEDIRKSGSGNAGATNMLRTHGKAMGVCTLLLDILKGVVPAFAAAKIGAAAAQSEMTLGLEFWKIACAAMPYIAGFFVVIGHNFPIFFGFKGGKGVATAFGAILMFDWKTGLIIFAAAILVMIFTRYVSLGSVVAAVLFSVLEAARMFYMQEWNLVALLFAVLMSAIVIFRHRSNIKRLANGTERKLGQKAE